MDQLSPRWRSVTRRAGPRMVAGALILLACSDDDGTGPGTEPRVESFSFEGNLAGWSAKATDIIVGSEPVAWEVVVTDQSATDGTHAVRFTLDNRSDAGKVWIERSFNLEPGTYHVHLSFDFATGDFGDLNLWTIIAGAFPESPSTGEDLQPAFREDTGHDQGSGAGLVWLDKAYDFSATTGGDGVLHVAIGVWGTYEVSRTYLLDALEIVFTPARMIQSSDRLPD
jgi:hypothetical protein